MALIDSPSEPAQQRPKRLAVRLFAVGAAAVAFCLAAGGFAAIVPYALGSLSGCVPPTGSCGDGVGWAMLISAPLTVPLDIIVAAACAFAAYQRVVRWHHAR